MKLIDRSANHLLFEKHLRIALAFSVLGVVIMIAPFIWPFINKPVVALGMIFFVVGLILGLSRESLHIDLTAKRFKYSDQFWPFPSLAIHDSLTKIDSVHVRDNSFDMSEVHKGRISYQKQIDVLIDYRGNPRRGFRIGIFDDLEQARQFAQPIAAQLNVSYDESKALKK